MVMISLLRFRSSVRLFFSGLAVLFFVAMAPGTPYAKEVDCLSCHEAVAKGKDVHPAVGMGCTACHTGVDAAEVPHKMTGTVAKGLSADQPDLCYGCHDKTKFTRKVVHPALAMGCTACHNPHASKNEKLLNAELPDLCFTCHDKTKFSGKFIHAPVGIGMCTACHDPHSSPNPKLLVSEPPDLCFTCHEKKEFTKKNVHAPVAGGMCLSCHRPHASEHTSLLVKAPVEVCLECHPDVRRTPHALAGFSGRGHAIGEPKRGRKPVTDPARPGKVFYCGSCHNPHSSDSMKLFRYKANSSFGICQYCHVK